MTDEKIIEEVTKLKDSMVSVGVAQAQLIKEVKRDTLTEESFKLFMDISQTTYNLIIKLGEVLNKTVETLGLEME